MNNVWFRWIPVALLASAVFFGCERKPGEKLYHEALAEWDAGHRVRARTLLEKSIRRRAGSQENAEAYNRLGILLWEMGNTDESIKAFDESCRIAPSQYDVLCNLGIALSAKNDISAAEQAFREASLIRPDDPRPLAFAGILYAKNQKWSEAQKILSRALERMPDDPRLQNALALTELHTAGPETALKRLSTLLGKHPGYIPARFNAASIQRYWLNNLPEARRGFETCLSIVSAEDPFVAAIRAQLQEISSDATGKKVVFTPPRKPNRAEAEKNFQKALAYHKANDLDSAARWYIKSIEADDTYAQAFYNLGLTCYAANRLEMAADAFAHAVRINPAYTEARYNSALVAYRLGNRDAALRELEIILARQPGYQPAIDLKARIK